MGTGYWVRVLGGYWVLVGYLFVSISLFGSFQFILLLKS